MGRGPTNDGEGFIVSADFKCFRKGKCGWGGGPPMIKEDLLLLLISNVLGRGCGAGRGPLMLVKDSLFLPNFRCFRKGVWGWGGGP